MASTVRTKQGITEGFSEGGNLQIPGCALCRATCR